MSFFTTKPEELSDAELDAIAEDAELKTAALLERERRSNVKAEAAEEEARQEAERQRQERVDGLLREHERVAEEVASIVAALGAGIVGAACALEKRDEALAEAWRIQGELRALGARPVPSVAVSFAPEAVTAARKLSRLIGDELAQNPLSSAFGSHPEVFK